MTLACTNAFATCWLMPRMGDFWRRYPEITVDHLITDDVRDFRRTEVDLRIRYGFGRMAGRDVDAAPRRGDLSDQRSRLRARARRRPPPPTSPSFSLLHVDWVDAEWTGWDELLRRAAIPHGPLPGRRFSSFNITLQACIEEQGLAIGWQRLIRDLVDAGKIVPFTDLKISAPGSYYLTWNTNRTLSKPACILKTWLLDMAAADTG